MHCELHSSYKKPLERSKEVAEGRLREISTERVQLSRVQAWIRLIYTARGLQNV